ncbi:hypothetical protein BM536_000110 [Streptomyces phaeoluteigriseus]|uniref:HTH tetR-type domain-containing protein n=2 Tax=Streptomyces phaeoluteigriseus TaxID=114686 RepID=A0A1V6MZK7_9ACTN|nr:hypothetical protein BM536_000110 [Streptomyces phaeoluteigriseus]
MSAHTPSTPQAATHTDPPRIAWRKAMRDRVLIEAHSLASLAGWDKVRVSEIAFRAGVSRPSIYSEFGNKAGIGRALVEQEADLFLLGLGTVLDTAENEGVEAVLTAGVTYALSEAARNPLIRAVTAAARGTTDSLLPYLSTRPDPVFTKARNLLAARLERTAPEVPAEKRKQVADVAVRLTVSHIILPATESAPTSVIVARAATAMLRT